MKYRVRKVLDYSVWWPPTGGWRSALRWVPEVKFGAFPWWWVGLTDEYYGRVKAYETPDAAWDLCKRHSRGLAWVGEEEISGPIGLAVFTGALALICGMGAFMILDRIGALQWLKSLMF